MRSLVLVLALLGIGGCAPQVSTLLAAPGAASRPLHGPPQPRRAVTVYLDERAAPASYRELGLVLVNTHTFIPVFTPLDMHIAVAAQRQRSGDQLGSRVFRDLRARAASLGADGVIVKSFAKSGEVLSISAVAIATRASAR